MSELARNDFRARYAGSLLGAAWAFAHPVLTLGMYIFVYRVAFRGAAEQDGVSFVLWLIVGITPWFFFSESLSAVTGAFAEYSFLVKKIPFDLAIIPSIKILSSAIVHAILWLIVVLIVIAWGLTPTMAWLQVVYYFVALVALTSGLGLLTASVAPFFRDMTQLVTVSLQFTFWLTPIGWSVRNAPAPFDTLLELNPLYYVISGLRDALLRDRPFWLSPMYCAYFWSLVAITHVAGTLLFRRLRPHIADVL